MAEFAVSIWRPGKRHAFCLGWLVARCWSSVPSHFFFEAWQANSWIFVALGSYVGGANPCTDS